MLYNTHGIRPEFLQWPEWSNCIFLKESFVRQQYSSEVDGQGIPEQVMAESSYRVMGYALELPDSTNNEKVDYWDLDDEYRVGLNDAISAALALLDDCENLPWTQLAAGMFHAWASRVDYPIQAFDELGLVTRSMWVSVARHLANLVSMEPGENLEVHERRWVGAAHRLAKPMES